MAQTLALILFCAAAALAGKNPVGVMVYLEDSTGYGMVIKNDTVKAVVYDTAGVKLWEEKEAVYTLDGSFEVWMGENGQTWPDQASVEIEYKGRQYGRIPVMPVFYAEIVEDAEMLEGTSIDSFALRQHTHTATGEILKKVQNSRVSFNAMHLENKTIDSLDTLFSFKEHIHGANGGVTNRVDSAGHADYADSARIVWRTLLFNGLDTSAFARTGHLHQGRYALLEHTHDQDTIRHMDSAAYADTARYAERARAADTVAAAYGAAGKVRQAWRVDTALYALAVRPFKQDSVKYSDTAVYTKTTITTKIDSARHADTATYARAIKASRADTVTKANTAAKAGILLKQKVDSAGHADTALVARQIAGKAAAAGRADTAAVALYAVAGYKADSAGRTDTAAYATRTGQTRIDSAGYGDTSAVARTTKGKIDTAEYADTAALVRTYRGKIDSAGYAANAAKIGKIGKADSMGLYYVGNAIDNSLGYSTGKTAITTTDMGNFVSASGHTAFRGDANDFTTVWTKSITAGAKGNIGMSGGYKGSIIEGYGILQPGGYSTGMVDLVGDFSSTQNVKGWSEYVTFANTGMEVPLGGKTILQNLTIRNGYGLRDVTVRDCIVIPDARNMGIQRSEFYDTRFVKSGSYIMEITTYTSKFYNCEFKEITIRIRNAGKGIFENCYFDNAVIELWDGNGVITGCYFRGYPTSNSSIILNGDQNLVIKDSYLTKLNMTDVQNGTAGLSQTVIYGAEKDPGCTMCPYNNKTYLTTGNSVICTP